MVKKSPNEKIFVPNEKNFVRTLLGKSPNVKKYVMDVKNYVRTFFENTWTETWTNRASFCPSLFVFIAARRSSP